MLIKAAQSRSAWTQDVPVEWRKPAIFEVSQPKIGAEDRADELATTINIATLGERQNCVMPGEFDLRVRYRRSFVCCRDTVYDAWSIPGNWLEHSMALLNCASKSPFCLIIRNPFLLCRVLEH